MTDAVDIRGNVAFNGARSGINFNDCFGSGSNVTENVLFNFNRETGQWIETVPQRICSSTLMDCFVPSSKVQDRT